VCSFGGRRLQFFWEVSSRSGMVEVAKIADSIDFNRNYFGSFREFRALTVENPVEIVQNH
jgi:hypothetical protein